jgi:hypothetical protein
MSLSDVVRVTISRETTTPTQTGFGTPLVMAYHTKFPERVREYESVDDMLTDGFAATDPAVLAVQALFSQSPHPTSALVGREIYTQKKKIRITPVSANLKASYDYTVEINGREATFTTDTNPTVAEITAGLKAAIDALVEPVVTTDGTTYLDIEDSVIGGQFRLYVQERQILRQENTTPDGTPNGIVADLAAVRNENDDWYAVVLTNNSGPVILAAAAYLEALVRVMLVSSADDDIYNSVVTTDIASDLQTAGYVRTMLMFHPKVCLQYPCAAWVGGGLPYNPGSITYYLKTLAGVDYTSLTATEKAAIKAKDCNYYTRISGVNVTQIGITPGHEWFDVINGIDWTQVRMQEKIFGALASSKKVPFTDRGIGVVENQVRGVLNQGAANEVYTDDPAPTVVVPLAKNVSAADKAARTLTGVTFRATLAGAIHEADVVGTVSL